MESSAEVNSVYYLDNKIRAATKSPSMGYQLTDELLEFVVNRL